MNEQRFRIVAMLKRGYQVHDISKFCGIPSKQVYAETQRLRRMFRSKNNYELVISFGGYL